MNNCIIYMKFLTFIALGEAIVSRRHVLFCLVWKQMEAEHEAALLLALVPSHMSAKTQNVMQVSRLATPRQLCGWTGCKVDNIKVQEVKFELEVILDNSNN